MDTSLHYRQGDVLIVQCEEFELPSWARPIAREEGRVVLAHGELTGHAHAIAEPDVEMVEQDGNYYIRVPREAVVQHEEHNPISLGPGTYQVIRQREYVPEIHHETSELSFRLGQSLNQPTPRGWWRLVAD
jgi:hypothetical protein